MAGFIKLYRDLLDNPIVCKDADHLAIWIYLLLEATHCERDKCFGGKRIVLKPGQLITGRKKISEELSINESKVYRVLNNFKSEQQIEQQTSSRSSLITIINWEKYQSAEQQSEHQVNIKRTTTEQQVNNNRTASEHINNNIKNDKNDNKYNYNVCFSEIWEIYPRKKEKGKGYEKYLATLKKGYSEEELKQAVIAYSKECKETNRDEKYIKHMATFFGPSEPFNDYLKKQEQVKENDDNLTPEELIARELQRQERMYGKIGE